MCKISHLSASFNSYCTGISGMEGYFFPSPFGGFKALTPTPPTTPPPHKVVWQNCFVRQVECFCFARWVTNDIRLGHISHPFFLQRFLFQGSEAVFFYRGVWRLCHTHLQGYFWLHTKSVFRLYENEYECENYFARKVCFQFKYFALHSDRQLSIEVKYLQGTRRWAFS